MEIDDASVVAATGESPVWIRKYKHGKVYLPQSFGVRGRASVTRYVKDAVDRDRDFFPSQSHISFLLFAVLFVMLVLWQRLCSASGGLSDEREYLYWQAILVGILLVAPNTHVMNCVWLIPTGVILFWLYRNLDDRFPAAALWVATIGLLAVAIPDDRAFGLLVPAYEGLLEYKYVLGEILMLVGLLWLVGKVRNGTQHIDVRSSEPSPPTTFTASNG
ncbi:MAG: hypothetical protein JW741_29450 [Sedimentisphaerales bacterium]|nr:hypothetical protein [Sedimentisphaerales bacterium]